MLRRHLAPLVVANRTPSLSILEGSSDDDRLVGPLAVRRARGWDAHVDGGRDGGGDEGAQSTFDEDLCKGRPVPRTNQRRALPPSPERSEGASGCCCIAPSRMKELGVRMG